MRPATLFGLEPSEATLVAAVVAAAVALLVHLYNQRQAARDRRRILHGEAYQAAMEWCEGVYRVRRRASDGSGDQELVERFHRLQERIAFYEGALTIESRGLGIAYRRLLDQVMGECRELTQLAWKHPGRHPSVDQPQDEIAPNLHEPKAEFLENVRKLGSPWPWRRWLVGWQLQRARSASESLERTAREGTPHLNPSQEQTP